MEGECNPFTPAQGFRAIAFNKRVISTPAVFLITVCFFLRHILEKFDRESVDRDK